MHRVYVKNAKVQLKTPVDCTWVLGPGGGLGFLIFGAVGLGFLNRFQVGARCVVDVFFVCPQPPGIFSRVSAVYQGYGPQ